jgi:hypothetical protein
VITHREPSDPVTMQAQRDVPPDMQCKDKFLVQSATVAKEVVPKEVTGDMVISHRLTVSVCSVVQRFILGLLLLFTKKIS